MKQFGRSSWKLVVGESSMRFAIILTIFSLFGSSTSFGLAGSQKIEVKRVQTNNSNGSYKYINGKRHKWQNTGRRWVRTGRWSNTGYWQNYGKWVPAPEAPKTVPLSSDQFDAAFAEMALNAVGVIRMVSLPNGVKADGDIVYRSGNKLHFRENLVAKTCTGVYVETPKNASSTKPWILSTAHCFVNSAGELSKYRRMAHFYINGQQYIIEPLSIIPHEKYRKGPAANDLVLFTVSWDQGDTFKQRHKPVPLIPEHVWLSPGTPTTFVGFGAVNDAGEGYGVGRAKRFINKYPDALDSAKAGNALDWNPMQQVNTYITEDGSKGINGEGDSGGPGFVQLQFSESEAPRWHLASLFAGNVSHDGKKHSFTELNRYAAGIDLRFTHDGWIERAIAKAHQNYDGNDALRKRFTQNQTILYGRQYYGTTWIRTLPEEIQNIYDRYDHLTRHEINQYVYMHLLLAKKRTEARAILARNSVNTLKASVTTISLPANPWRALYNDWVQLSKMTKTSGGTKYYANSKTYTETGNFRIRNTGDTTVSFGPVYADSKRFSGTYRLGPGQYVDIYDTNGGTFTFKELELWSYKGHDKLLIHMIPADTSGRINVSGQNYVNVKPPRMYQVVNNYSGSDLADAVRFHNFTGGTLNIPIFTMYRTSYKSGWKTWDYIGNIKNNHYANGPRYVWSDDKLARYNVSQFRFFVKSGPSGKVALDPHFPDAKN